MATLCTSGLAIIKAGANVGAVPVTAWDGYIEEAEGFLNALVKYDLVTNWITVSGLSAAPMLSEYCCRSAAIQGILYDPSGYTDGIEAENMVTVHWSRMLQIQELLEADGVQDFMKI